MNVVDVTRRLCVLFVFTFAPTEMFAFDLIEKSPPVLSPDANTPTLIWDIDLSRGSNLPRNFRTTDDRLKPETFGMPATTGLKELCASGSGEFTPEGLRLVLGRTRGPVAVFDLRQETHVFVNNLPVSWYASRDWANVGRRESAVQADEAARVQALQQGSEIDIRPGEPVKKDNAHSVAAERVKVEVANTEQDVVSAAGASYVRLTVTDHARPLDETVDRFVLAVRGLPEKGWAHFHCEAGRGRTTTFMVLYDMLRNASRVSLEGIVRRQKILGYDYDVLEPADPGDWKAPYTADRAAFVRAFYEYARANPNGRPQVWSEWLRDRRGQNRLH